MRLLALLLLLLPACTASFDLARSPGHLNVTVSADLTGNNDPVTLPLSRPGPDDP